MTRTWLFPTLLLAVGCTTPKAAEAPDAKKDAVTAEAPPAKSEEPAKAEADAPPAKVEEPAKTEAPPTKVEEPAKVEAPAKTEPAKTEPVKTEPAKPPAKPEPVKAEPVKAEPPKAEPTAAVAAPDKKIERLWKSKCASCHGMDGKAATDKGRKMKMNDMSQKAWQAARSDAQLKKATVDGVNKEKDGVKQEMDAYGDLAADQLAGLVQYMRWLGAPR